MRRLRGAIRGGPSPYAGHSARAGRADVAAPGADGRRDDLAPIAAGAASDADPGFIADAFDRAGARAVAATLLAGLVGTLLAGLIGVGGGNRQVLGDEAKGEKPHVALSSVTEHAREEDACKAALSDRTASQSPARRSRSPDTVGRRPIRTFRVRQPLETGSPGNGSRSFRTQMVVSDLTFEDREIGLAEDRDSPDRWGMPLFVAWAPGFGPDWADGDADRGPAAPARPRRRADHRADHRPGGAAGRRRGRSGSPAGKSAEREELGAG